MNYRSISRGAALLLVLLLALPEAMAAPRFRPIQAIKTFVGKFRRTPAVTEQSSKTPAITSSSVPKTTAPKTVQPRKEKTLLAPETYDRQAEKLLSNARKAESAYNTPGNPGYNTPYLNNRRTALFAFAQASKYRAEAARTQDPKQRQHLLKLAMRQMAIGKGFWTLAMDMRPAKKSVGGFVVSSGSTALVPAGGAASTIRQHDAIGDSRLGPDRSADLTANRPDTTVDFDTPEEQLDHATQGGSPRSEDDGENPITDAPKRQKQKFTKPEKGIGLGGVRELAKKNDLRSANHVLRKMESRMEQLRGGGFIDRLKAKAYGLQVARARRTLRNEARRAKQDTAQAYARTYPNVKNSTEAMINDLLKNKDKVLASLMAQNLTEAEANEAIQEHVAGLRAEARELIRGTTFRQADRVLRQLAAAEPQAGGFARGIIRKVKTLFTGSAQRTLQSSQKDMVKMVNSLVKRGPEGAMAASLLLSHEAKRDSRLDGKRARTISTALKNLDREIARQKRRGNMTAVNAAYIAKQTIVMDHPKASVGELRQQVKKDMKNAQRDMRDASVVAWTNLAKYAKTAYGAGNLQSAQQLCSLLLGVKTRMASADPPVALPSKLSRQIESLAMKVDDRLNGREGLGKRMGRKILGGGKFLVNFATTPLRIPFMIGKSLTQEAGDAKLLASEESLRNFFGKQQQQQQQQAEEMYDDGGGAGPADTAQLNAMF